MCGSSKATKVEIDRITKTARVEFDGGFGDSSKYGFCVLDLVDTGRPRLVDSGAYDPRNNWSSAVERPYEGNFGLYLQTKFGSAMVEKDKFPELERAIRDGVGDAIYTTPEEVGVAA